MALLFGFVGLFFNPILAVIAIFIWMMSGGGVLDGQAQDSARWADGAPVNDHGLSNLEPGEPVRRAVGLTLSGFQQDFPVVDGSEVVGFITHPDVLKALAERGSEVRADDVMHRTIEKTVPTELADVAFTHLRARLGGDPRGRRAVRGDPAPRQTPCDVPVARPIRFSFGIP